MEDYQTNKVVKEEILAQIEQLAEKYNKIGTLKKSKIQDSITYEKSMLLF